MGSFQTYIFRVMKETKTEMNVSKKSMSMMTSIIDTLFEKLMEEARRLLLFSKKQTLSSREIETAIKIIFPGELCKLAIQYGRDCLRKVNEGGQDN